MPSPIVIATIQGTILSIISNILAQTINAYRSNTPLALNPTPILTFALYSILSTPPNYLWQELLESWFPSYPPPLPSTSSTSEKDKPTKVPTLSTTNTIKKFLADQAISAPLNTLAFLAYMKGSSIASGAYPAGSPSTSQIIREVMREFPAMHITSLKLWPAVGLLSFTLIPVERRILFGNVAALGWNVYLGIMLS